MPKTPPAQATVYVTVSEPSKSSTGHANTSTKSPKTPIAEQTIIRVSAPFEDAFEDKVFISAHSLTATELNKNNCNNEDSEDSSRSTPLETNVGLSTYHHETASNTSFDADWRELPYEKLSTKDIPELLDGLRLFDPTSRKAEAKAEKKKKNQRGVSWKEKTEDLQETEEEWKVCENPNSQIVYVDAEDGKKKRSRCHLLIQIRRKKKVVNSSTQLSVLTDDSDSSSTTVTTKGKPPTGRSKTKTQSRSHKQSEKHDSKTSDTQIRNWMAHTFSHLLQFVRKRGSPQSRHINKSTSPMGSIAETFTVSTKDKWSREPVEEFSCEGDSLPYEVMKTIKEETEETEKPMPDLPSQRQSTEESDHHRHGCKHHRSKHRHHGRHHRAHRPSHHCPRKHDADLSPTDTDSERELQQ